MGNIAGRIRKDVFFVASATVVIIAKPAYDCTVRLVQSGASIIAKNQCNQRYKQLDAIEANVEKVVKVINETNERCNERLAAMEANVEKVAKVINETYECLTYFKDAEKHLNAKLPMYEEVKVCTEKIKSSETKLSNVESKVLESYDHIKNAGATINELPHVIEEIAKKYSMLLHNEHSQIAKLIDKTF